MLLRRHMQIKKTGLNRPPIMLVYGDHKIGKSTFAAGMPKPVFVQVEDGLIGLSVEATDLCKSLNDFHMAIDLIEDSEGYKTLVIDSLDWLERLIWKDVCEKKGWEQIGDGPYGAGYKLALKEWGEVLKRLIDINQEKKMMICLIAHAKISKFEDPERDNYDRYDLDLHEKSGNLICQAMDIIGFASGKIVVQSKKEGLKNSSKAKMLDERVLNLEKSAAYEAGNRFGLPAQIPLEWAALNEGLKKFVASAKGNLAAAKDKHEENKGVEQNG